MPGLWARSPIGGVHEANHTLMFLSLSLSLPLSLKINKIFLKVQILKSDKSQFTLTPEVNKSCVLLKGHPHVIESVSGR